MRKVERGPAVPIERPDFSNCRFVATFKAKDLPGHTTSNANPYGYLLVPINEVETLGEADVAAKRLDMGALYELDQVFPIGELYDRIALKTPEDLLKMVGPTL